ncbi:hypothetical protein K4H04_22625, partial [Mycobacterium tuberculosis]|nr:hypothetical protein [Mycobacterium tuberculosis]
MKRRTAHFAFAMVAAACAGSALWFGVRLHHAQRINSAISRASIQSADSTVPQALLMQALALARAGRYQAALKGYKSLLDGAE